MFRRIIQSSLGLAAITIAVYALLEPITWGGKGLMARPTATAIICLGVAIILGSFNGLQK